MWCIYKRNYLHFIDNFWIYANFYSAPSSGSIRKGIRGSPKHISRSFELQILFTLFGNLTVHSDTLHIVRILCIESRHFPSYQENLQSIMNLTQKISVLAKSFRVPMLPCYPDFPDSVPLTSTIKNRIFLLLPSISAFHQAALDWTKNWN